MQTWDLVFAADKGDETVFFISALISCDMLSSNVNICTRTFKRFYLRYPHRTQAAMDQFFFGKHLPVEPRSGQRNPYHHSPSGCASPPITASTFITDTHDIE